MPEWLNIFFIVLLAILLFLNIVIGLFNVTLWIITRGLKHDLEKNGDFKEFIDEIKNLRKEVSDND